MEGEGIDNPHVKDKTVLFGVRCHSDGLARRISAKEVRGDDGKVSPLFLWRSQFCEEVGAHYVVVELLRSTDGMERKATHFTADCALVGRASCLHYMPALLTCIIHCQRQPLSLFCKCTLLFHFISSYVLKFTVFGNKTLSVDKKELGDHLNYASVIIIDEDDYSPASSKALARIILNSCHQIIFVFYIPVHAKYLLTIHLSLKSFLRSNTPPMAGSTSSVFVVDGVDGDNVSFPSVYR